MDVINISPSIDEIWPGNDHLQKFYLNLHKVSLGDSITVDDIDSVLVTYYGGVAPHGRTERMWDDGKHWDGEVGDGIYGYSDLLDLSDIDTEHFTFHLHECCHIFLHALPFRETPEIPELTYPIEGMTISQLKPTFRWELVPDVESYGVAVFDSIPTPGTIYENMVWKKDSGADIATEISMEADSVELALGRTYYWALWCYDEGGYVEGEWKYPSYSMGWASFSTLAVGVSSSFSSVPQTFKLAQNHPNPFNSDTKIAYSLPGASRVTLTVYNILGQMVEVLVDSEMQPGYHSMTLNAGDLSSGIYFYRITAGEFVVTKRMVLLK